MADLKQIVSRKAENDTKWREQQQAERENTVAMQDAGITEIIYTDPYPDELSLGMLDEAGISYRVFRADE